MDFFERLFAISPDGGNGTLEAAFLSALLLLLAAPFLLPRIVRLWKRSHRATLRS